MILVHSFCSKDYHRSVEFFRWCAEFGFDDKHRCLLVASKASSDSERSDVRLAAITAFYDVQLITPSIVDESGWPTSCNTQWKTARAYIANVMKEPWLWTEPDCVPIRSGWLQEIDNEYERVKKPFMGAIFDVPKRHMTGCGVYPVDPVRFNRRLINPGAKSWDNVDPENTLKHFHETKLIQHVWGDVKNNVAPTFKDIASLDLIKSEAVMFHRCKDGTLIHRLRNIRKPNVNNKVKSKDKSFSNITVEMLSRLARKLIRPCDVPAIVQLGRIGDILNILPIARFFNSICHHSPVPVVVHHSMEKILARVGYVTPVIWGGEMSAREDAKEFAASKFSKVMCPQLFHETGVDDPITDHFNTDQWELCGLLSHFDYFPLEFDRRDWMAEEKLFKSLRLSGKPILCYNLNGNSSPLRQSQELESELKGAFKEYDLVDLSKFRTEFFTDQLGILDRAHALITIDTSTLHLVQASHCPYISLLSGNSPHSWKASKVRRKPEMAIYYSDVKERLPDIISTLSQLLSRQFTSGNVIHVVQRRTVKDDRINRAVSLWDDMYASYDVIPGHVWSSPRDASGILGDRRHLPFLKDVLNVGIAQSKKTDIIIFTNDDVVFTPEAVRQIRLKLRFQNMVTAGRIDLKGKMPERINEYDKHYGSRHLGRDMVAFNAGWLRENIDLIPDFLLGASDWDVALASFSRKLSGCKSSNENFGMVFAECELCQGMVLHEKHDAYWSRPDNSDVAPSQVYNRFLAEEYFRFSHPDVHLFWFNRL